LSYLGGYASGYIVYFLSALLILAIYNFFDRGIPAIREKMKQNQGK